MTAPKLLSPPAAVCAACDHDAAAHRHYRSGLNCSLCDCARLVRARRPRLRDRLQTLVHGALADRAPLLLLAVVLGGLVAGIVLGFATGGHAWVTTTTSATGGTQ